MNTLCLEKYGVSEMETREMKAANGGLAWYAAIGVGIAIAAVTEIIRDWDNFKAGLNGNCES